MAVTGRDIPNNRRPISILPGAANLGFLAYLVTAVLALLAVYVLLSSALGWARVQIDNVRYGTPRTYHLTIETGPPGSNLAPTHFVAMNLNRQVVIVELPNGDGSQARTLPGPYLFGANEGLTPVKLRSADLNGDSVGDLIVRVKDEEMVYLYREGSYTLITPEERQQLLEAARAGQ